MSINYLPAELLVQILEHISLQDSCNIMQVSKKWYRTYHGIIYRQKDAKFEELLYSAPIDWKILPCTRTQWTDFLLSKLHNFCDSFDIFYLGFKLQEIYESLRQEWDRLSQEEDRIEKALVNFERSPEYDGWFPDKLWNDRKKNRNKLATIYWSIERVAVLRVRLSDWTQGRFLESL